MGRTEGLATSTMGEDKLQYTFSLTDGFRARQVRKPMKNTMNIVELEFNTENTSPTLFYHIK